MKNILTYNNNVNDLLDTEWPPFLYKFRNWGDNYHKKILTNNEIYFAEPNEFKDNKDCRLPMNFDVPLEDAYNYALGLLDDKDCKDIDMIKAQTKDLLHNKQRQKEFEEIFYTEYCSHVGLCSFCYVNDNLEVWETYAKENGFCVVFNSEELRKNRFAQGGYVKYETELPFIKCTDEIIRKEIITAFTKLKTYEFEHEYRLFKSHDQEREFHFSENCLDHIILSPDIDSMAEMEIREVMSEKHPQIKIFQAQKQNGKILIG